MCLTEEDGAVLVRDDLDALLKVRSLQYSPGRELQQLGGGATPARRLCLCLLLS